MRTQLNRRLRWGWRRFRGVAGLFVLAAVSLIASSHFRIVDDPRNPAFDRTQLLAASREVISVLKKSCYDCHSYETQWPWASRLPIVRGFVEGDVRRGRKAFNLSSWKELANRDVEQAAGLMNGVCEEITLNAMPLRSYVLVHPETRLSDEEKALVCNWFSAESKKLETAAAPILQ